MVGSSLISVDWVIIVLPRESGEDCKITSFFSTVGNYEYGWKSCADVSILRRSQCRQYDGCAKSTKQTRGGG